MCRNLLRRFILVVSFIAAPLTGAASSTAPRFKDECVGRSLVSLPEDVEVAAMLPDDFHAELEGGVAQPAFRFVDGDSATSNSIVYGGSLVVTHKISRAIQDAFYKLTLETRSKVVLSIEQERSTRSDASTSVFEQLSTANQIGNAWRVDAHYIAYFSVGEYSVLWRASAAPNESSELVHDFHNVVSGLRSRPIFTIPKREGVCLPHIFIADDGRTFRNVRTAFRMKSHPDLLIVLEDSTAFVPRRGKKSPAESLTDFWEQFEYRSTVRSVRSAWHFPKMRALRMGQRAAVASFVNITRDTGVVDFGYAAISLGKSKAAIDTPDLTIYAVRDAALADKKGVKPITEKEFVWIVERIAKSVRTRAGG
jgi:hypothetical protein